MNTFDTIRKKLGIYINPEYRQLTKDLRLINERTDMLYKTRRKHVKQCLLEDTCVIGPINNEIDKLHELEHMLHEKRDELVKTLLNTFPLNTPCTIDHISKTLHLPRGYVYLAMRRDSGEVLLPNWKVINMYGMRYYSRFE